MSTAGLIGTIFVVLAVLIVVGEWFKREIKPRLQNPQTGDAPGPGRGSR
jgi:hypothetical protein